MGLIEKVPLIQNSFLIQRFNSIARAANLIIDQKTISESFDSFYAMAWSRQNLIIDLSSKKFFCRRAKRAGKFGGYVEPKGQQESLEMKQSGARSAPGNFGDV